MNEETITIRECTTIDEFDECCRLQREAFGLPDLEISPRRHLIVARKAGGWILGAFLGGRLIGFVLHLVALREREVIGYSHMMAIAAAHQNRGVGARLKWAQRERALAEGVRTIVWTWDPLQARNAHFNLNRLGATVRSYAANFYGTDYGQSARGTGIDSDRLFADWNLEAAHVSALAEGNKSPLSAGPAATIEVPPNWGELLKTNPRTAREEQLRVRAEFDRGFRARLVCAGFDRAAARPRYLLYREEDAAGVL